MRKPKATSQTKRKTRKCSAVVVSVGCPSGIGPEVSVAAATRFRDAPVILVGDPDTIAAAARLRGVDPQSLADYAPGSALTKRRVHVMAAGPRLKGSDRRPGRPNQAAGAAQLAYIDTAYQLVQELPGSALVTGPVSKLAIARSGAPRAATFLGHTEWLRRRDAAPTSVMCFASKRLTTSLVTTHLPLAQVSRALTAQRVREATQALVELLRALDIVSPRVAVCSLNPHAGEGELLGNEENRAIVPGVRAARRSVGATSHISGPLGAETAFRKALAGAFDGVVAMYHDQATIPMKLLAFGEAVNVTMGLSVVRTSVDHGTGYDIAWRGTADELGMLSAMRLGARLIG